MTADGNAADNGNDSSLDMDGSLPGGGYALPPVPAVAGWPVASTSAESDMSPLSLDAT